MRVTRREEFDALFDRHVVEHLAPLGFRRHGKSLFWVEGVDNVSLIRFGGKFASAGWAVWMLGFRHTFLEDLHETPRGDFVKTFADYPFKFSPRRLRRRPSWLWRYRWLSNSLFFEVDGLEWKDRGDEAVARELEGLTRFLVVRFLPWARAMTPRRAMRQIRFWGRGRWIEERWVEAYRTHLAAPEPPSRGER